MFTRCPSARPLHSLPYSRNFAQRPSCRKMRLIPGGSIKIHLPIHNFTQYHAASTRRINPHGHLIPHRLSPHEGNRASSHTGCCGIIVLSVVGLNYSSRIPRHTMMACTRESLSVITNTVVGNLRLCHRSSIAGYVFLFVRRNSPALNEAQKAKNTRQGAGFKVRFHYCYYCPFTTIFLIDGGGQRRRDTVTM